ncbi:MAG: hypothetical protein QOF47_2602, partial [Mycobacterium sp.]|nr:hypothetical protein [Mycobacterium sp.]
VEGWARDSCALREVVDGDFLEWPLVEEASGGFENCLLTVIA